MIVGCEIMIIPDTQVRPDVNTDHLEAAGNYAVAKKPDIIVHLGDHWDMHSLSSYDKGKKNAEGARYQDDIDAGIEAMQRLLKPINDYNKKRKKNKEKQYKPEKHFLIGNHEQRIERHVEANPELYRKLSYKDFELEKDGWIVHDFLEVLEIEDILFSHYFYNPMSGRPYGGKCHTKLNNVGRSFIMGHQQCLDMAIKDLPDGSRIRGLVAGAFYSHDEGYKGYQGNGHWRGAVYLHEVKDADYNLMELSLDYLVKNWL